MPAPSAPSGRLALHPQRSGSPRSQRCTPRADTRTPAWGSTASAGLQVAQTAGPAARAWWTRDAHGGRPALPTLARASTSRSPHSGTHGLERPAPNAACWPRECRGECVNEGSSGDGFRSVGLNIGELRRRVEITRSPWELPGHLPQFLAARESRHAIAAVGAYPLTPFRLRTSSRVRASRTLGCNSDSASFHRSTNFS